MLVYSSYDYDSSSSSRLSAGAIAGITIAGILSFLIFSTFLIIVPIYLKHRYVNQQHLSCNITPQTNQQTVMASAPLQSAAAYNPTQPPVVCYTNPPAGGGGDFLTTPHQFSGYPPPTAPQPQCFTGPQPPATQFGYMPEPQPKFVPGPQPMPQPTPFLEPPLEHFPQPDNNSEPPPDYYAEPPPEYTPN